MGHIPRHFSRLVHCFALIKTGALARVERDACQEERGQLFVDVTFSPQVFGPKACMFEISVLSVTDERRSVG